MLTKKEIRQEVKGLKKSLSDEQRSFLSQDVAIQITALEIFQKAKNILIYFPLNDELDTTYLLREWIDAKNFFLPVVEGDNLKIKQVKSLNELKKGDFGILEPNSEQYFTAYNTIDLVIVPGVAFTSTGIRVGRGRGYYDRLLPLLSKAFFMGICYPFQLFQNLPSETHDCMMDLVIS